MSVNELLVKAYLYDICPWINFSAKNSRKVTYDESNEVMAKMSSQLQAHELVTCTEILREVLIENGLASENNSPVSMFFSPDRVKARINERAMLLDPDLKLIDAGFMLALENIADFSLDELKTMVLYSAMRFGLLLNKDYIQQLNHCLYNPPQYYNGTLWFELKIPGIDNIHIWHPDSLTLALLGKWYARDASENEFEDTRLDVFKKIKALLKFKQSDLRIIKSNKLLADGISMVISNKIPAYINDITKGETDSRTVNRECNLRLCTGKSPRATHRHELSSERKIKSICKSSLRNFENDDSVIRSIKKHLKNGDSTYISKSILDLIVTEEKSITPITALLGRWVSQRLIGKNYWGSRSSRSTVEKRFQYIALDIIDVFENVNPIDLSTEDLFDLYYEMVENRGEVESFYKVLEDFHYYIQEFEGATKAHKAFPWSKKQKYRPVDSNIITWPETSAIEGYYWDKLKNNSMSISERQIMRLSLIVYALGFYTGMRRQEIIGARISDITTVGRKIYNVRKHKNKSVKSSNSIRQLPIWIYLPEEILKLVNQYLKYRIDNGAKSDDYLFNISGDDVTTKINERKVFSHIHWVMQSVTGYGKARFHHLRHSCGTWMLWKLTIPYLSNKNLGFAGMPEFTDEELMVYQEHLLAHTSLKYPSEKIVPEISRMLGHSNGGMSLGHYVHSAYWILNDYRLNLMPNLSTNLLAKLAGISARQIQKLSDANDSPLTPNLIKPSIIKKLSKYSKSPDLSDWVDPSKKIIGEYNRELTGERVVEYDTWNALLEYFNEGTDMAVLTQKYNIEESDFNSYINHTKLIFTEDKDKRIELNKIPTSKKERKTTELMLKNFSGLSQAKRGPVNHAVNYFINNNTKNGVMFTSKEELSNYLKIFDSLTLWKTPRDSNEKIAAFRLTLSSNYPPGSLDRQNQWDFWCRSNSFQSFQLSDRFDEAVATNRGLIFVDYMTEKPLVKSSNTKRLTDKGFVLGMYILAVMHCYDDNY